MSSPLAFERSGRYFPQMRFVRVPAVYRRHVAPSRVTCSLPSLALDMSRPTGPYARLRSILALSVFTVLAACGGSDDPTPPPTPTPGTLAVAVASGTGSAVTGTSATVAVNITRGGSFTGAVALAAEGVPTGVTATFTPASLPTGTTSSSLALAVAANAAAGTYPITIRATGASVTAATTTFTLTVAVPQTPAFTLAATPAAITIVAGQSGTSQIAVTRTGGFTGNVQLTLDNPPTGVTGIFTPNPATTTPSSLAVSVASGTAAGAYTLTVRGTGTGAAAATTTIALTVTAPAPVPTLALALTPTAVTITQAQQSAALPIVITRGGGLTGDVQFALEGAPTGVTGIFTPNPATGSSTQLVVNVAQSVAAGAYNVVVRGTVGTVTSTAALALTVTAASAGDFALSVVPATVTVTSGQTVNTTVNIARSGGFTGAVNLTVSGLPAGVSANFVPASATGTQAQLSIITQPSAAAGTFTAVVRGNATGLTERTVNLGVTVQSAPVPGTGNVTFRFCNNERFPLWFAYRDGTNGAWTRVLPGANQTYAFTINENVGAVAVVTAISGGGTSTFIYQQTRAELIAAGNAECVQNPSTKTVNGTVAGLSAGQTAYVALGGTLGTVTFPSTAFSLTGVLDRATDLVAARAGIDFTTFAIVPDRFVLRRNLNPAAGSSIPVIDFGSAEAFAPATATYTLANNGTDDIFVTGGFFTSNGAAGFFSIPVTGGGNSRPVYGIPLARTQAGDLHQVQALATGGNGATIRGVTQYNRELVNRTLTLGSNLNAPTFTTLAGAPYQRYRAAGTFQAEYNQEITISYQQTTSGGRAWTLYSTAGYLGGASSYSLDLPDLSAVAGFNNTWGLQTGSATQYSATAFRTENIPASGELAENYRLIFASRTGNVP